MIRSDVCPQFDAESERFRANAVTREEGLRWSWLAGRTAAFIWDYDTWDALTSRQVDLALASGSLSVLPLTLSTRAGVQLFAGDLSEAEAHFEHAEAAADATDARTAAYAAVLIAAFRGYEVEARELIGAAAKDFAARGEGMGVTLTRCAEAALGNGLGQYEQAYLAAERGLEDPDELWFAPWVTVEMIEAASRTGRLDRAGRRGSRRGAGPVRTARLRPPPRRRRRDRRNRVSRHLQRLRPVVHRRLAHRPRRAGNARRRRRAA
jgi:hypothetical protein